MISTSKGHSKHPFAGWNTQQKYKSFISFPSIQILNYRVHGYQSRLTFVILNMFSLSQLMTRQKNLIGCAEVLLISKVRRDYRRRHIVIVNVWRPCLTFKRHQQEELANDRR